MFASLPRTVRDDDEVDAVDEVPDALAGWLKADDNGEPATDSSLIGEGRWAALSPGLPSEDLEPGALCCLDSKRLFTAARSLAISASFGLLLFSAPLCPVSPALGVVSCEVTGTESGDDARCSDIAGGEMLLVDLRRAGRLLA